MSIQIFGTKKNPDTRKAERFFKERGIKFQSVDLKEKGLSKGELLSVIQAVGGIDAIIDPNCKDRDLLTFHNLVPEDRFEKLLENQELMKQPKESKKGIVFDDKALIGIPNNVDADTFF